MSAATNACSREQEPVSPLRVYVTAPSSDKQRVTLIGPDSSLPALTISHGPAVDHGFRGFRAWQYDHQYSALERELHLCTAEADALLSERPLSATNRSKDIVLRERIRELLHEQDVLNEVYER